MIFGGCFCSVCQTADLLDDQPCIKWPNVHFYRAVNAQYAFPWHRFYDSCIHHPLWGTFAGHGKHTL